MSEKRKKKLLTGLVVMVIGISMVILILAYAGDYVFIIDLFYILLGLIITVIGAMILRPALSKKNNEMEFVESDFFISPQTMNADKNTHSLLKFRDDLAQFFAAPGIEENAAIQYDTTQLFKNMLDFQKRRLDELHVKLEYKTERRNYSGQPVKQDKYFDGKNEVTEIKEQIESKRRYSAGEKTLLIRTDAELAHYTKINARQTGADKVICPSCGAESTRENLIDGCDFCHTRFTVEDLGEKIASFAIRDDYEIEYAKYREKRGYYAFRAFAFFFIIAYFFVSFIMVVLMFDEEASGAIGVASWDFFEPLLLVGGMVVVGTVFGGFLAAGGAMVYGVTIFPAMEATARAKHSHGKRMEELKKIEGKGKLAEQNVRKYDSLFSLTGFYSNIQNKLAVLFFAGSKAQMNAFSEIDLSPLQKEYSKIIDFDLDDIVLESYEVSDGLQKAGVSAKMTVYELDGTRVKDKSKHVKMKLIKSADCKTQVICAPQVMRCYGCGSSLSLAEGLRCSYCGTKADVKKYDWAIAEYKEI